MKKLLLVFCLIVTASSSLYSVEETNVAKSTYTSGCFIVTRYHTNLCTAYRYKHEKTGKKTYEATNVWVGGEFDESYSVTESTMPDNDFSVLKSIYKKQNNIKKEEKKTKKFDFGKLFDEDLADTWKEIFDDVKNKKN